MLDDPSASDWTFREIVDAKADSPTGVSNCERCGRSIRWVHVLARSQDGSHLYVGCCCAVRLCDDYDAKAAERKAKNRAQRKHRFLDLAHWKISRNNPANFWRTVRAPDLGKINVTVFLRN